MEDASVVLVASQGTGFNVFAFADNIDSVAAGKSHISLGHFAVGVGPVDAGVGTSTTLLASDLGFSQTAGPVPVDAGNYTADVRLAAETGTPLLSLSVTLEARKHYLVLAVGSFNDLPNPSPSLVAYELADYSINARIAFVHGVPADLPVNVVANGALSLFRNLK